MSKTTKSQATALLEAAREQARRRAHGLDGAPQPEFSASAQRMGVDEFTARQVPTDLIDPDPRQPRKHFDQAAQDELRDSIAAQGRVVQPIVVRPTDEGRYMVVTGERRLRAVKELRIPTIHAVIEAHLLEHEIRAIQVMENWGSTRAPVTPYEEACALFDMAPHYKTQAEMAAALGVSESAVSKRLALMQAAPPVRELFEAGLVADLDIAAELGRLRPDSPVIDKLLAMVAAGEKLTREAVSLILPTEPQAGAAPSRGRPPTPPSVIFERMQAKGATIGVETEVREIDGGRSEITLRGDPKLLSRLLRS